MMASFQSVEDITKALQVAGRTDWTAALAAVPVLRRYLSALGKAVPGSGSGSGAWEGEGPEEVALADALARCLARRDNPYLGAKFQRLADAVRRRLAGPGGLCSGYIPTFDSTEWANAVYEADVALNQLEEAARAVAEVSPRSLGDSADEPTVIVSLGKQQYRIGAHRPLAVTPPEDAVLQAFLQCQTMKEGMLKTCVKAVADPAKVLRGLRTNYEGMFAPAIDLPGKKNGGGYHVRITSNPAPSNPH